MRVVLEDANSRRAELRGHRSITVYLQIAIGAAIAVLVMGIVHNRYELTRRERLERIAFAKKRGVFEHQRELIEAVQNGDEAGFKRLLGRPAPSDLSVLFLFDFAARIGRYEIVRHLLDLGCDPEGMDHGGNPLEAAACFGHTDTVRLLLSHHARPDPRWAHPVSRPLGWAAARGHTGVAALLLSAGADVNGRVDSPPPMPLFDSAHPSLRSQTKSSGFRVPGEISAKPALTPLMLAAGSGSVEMMNLLLGAHASVNLRSAEGMTALGYAKSFKHAQIVKILQLNGGIG
jgi:hypothetical protein